MTDAINLDGGDRAAHPIGSQTAQATVQSAAGVSFQAIAESLRTEAGPLVDRVSSLIEQAQSFVAAQANATLTLRNWHIGRMIDVAVLRESRAGHDTELVASLGRQVSWTHFRELLPLTSDEARAFYVKETVARHLGVRDLRWAISRKAFERREIADSQIPDGSAMPTDVFRDEQSQDEQEVQLWQ